MNENYILHLMNGLRVDTGLSIEDMWTVDDLRNVIGDWVWEPADISFIKKDGIKPFKFIEEKPILSFNFEHLDDIDMEYFRQRLYESLRIPNRYLYNNNPQQSVSGYDEFH